MSAHFRADAQDKRDLRDMHSVGISAAITSSDTW